jgi:hypothetical protein
LIHICPIVLLQVPPVSVWLDRLPFYRLKRPRPFSLVATSANFPSSFRWPIPYFPYSQLPLADGRLAVLLLSAESDHSLFPWWPLPPMFLQASAGRSHTSPVASFRLPMDDLPYFFFRLKPPLPFSLVAATACVPSASTGRSPVSLIPASACLWTTRRTSFFGGSCHSLFP